MTRAVQQVLAEIDAQSQPTSREEIRNVIATSCRDPQITEFVADAFARAGSDGVVTISWSLGNIKELRVSSGMQIDRGYVSDKFVNNPRAQTCSFEDCVVLITDHRITQLPEILPVLEQVTVLRRPLLIISDELSEEVLQTLLVNNLRGTLPCVAIQWPGSRESRTELLQDLAVFTGGRAVTRDLGSALSRIAVQDLGQAGRVIVDRARTAITVGKGDKAVVHSHIQRLRTAMASATNPYERKNSTSGLRTSRDKLRRYISLDPRRRNSKTRSTAPNRACIRPRPPRNADTSRAEVRYSPGGSNASDPRNGSQKRTDVGPLQLRQPWKHRCES